MAQSESNTDLYGLEFEEEEEDVSDDLDKTYEPPKKIPKKKITRTKSKSGKKITATSTETTTTSTVPITATSAVTTPTCSASTSTTTSTGQTIANDAEKKKQIAALIKNHECLWNKSHKNFRNAQVRESAWDNVAKEANITGNSFY